MKKITTSLLTICLIITTLTIKAQTFTNYTITEGLPHNNVLCLVQDTAGNMWFGTQDGIAKFDGVSTWTIFNTTTNPVLPDNTITAIAVDSDNNIWIGTDFGVSVYDGSTFTTYTTVDGLGNNRINHISQAANGDIWFGDFSGATVYDGVTFTAYNTTDGLPFGGVTYVDFDSNGDVYMASGLGGVIQFDGVGFTIYNSGLESNVVRSIVVDGSDNKWVGTAKGISVLNSSNVVVDAHTIMLVLPAPDTLNPVEDIKINSQGDIWTGIYVDYLVTEGGIAVNSGGSSWTDYDVNDGLVGPVIRKIWIDKQDNVWTGTSSGVSKLSFPTSVNPIAFTSNGFNIYPNPASDVLNIAINNNENYQNIEMYNAAMQLVKQVSLNSSQQTVKVSLSNLDRGMYFVKYGNQVKKVVVN
ncbi:MAG: T9SS type A sorting domain-containing protein [Flavobacteriales bacterium]|nr:T9SS type A sorting domain-containing protein [Flavobacteriales bacterium]